MLEKLNADSEVRVDVYLELYEKLLRNAEELYGRNDLVQASEKYWSAICALLNAIAELRSWRYYSHHDYNEVVEKLFEEFKKPEISKLFAITERLHANYYHNFIKSKEVFNTYRESVQAYKETNPFDEIVNSACEYCALENVH